jgi:hypothetical protein
MRTDDLHIEYHAGKYQVVRTSNGIDDRINVGPRWLLPKNAIAYIESLRAWAAHESLESSGGDMTRGQPEADRASTVHGLSTAVAP